MALWGLIYQKCKLLLLLQDYTHHKCKLQIAVAIARLHEKGILQIAAANARWYQKCILQIDAAVVRLYQKCLLQIATFTKFYCHCKAL